MASKISMSGGGDEDAAELHKTLKEGERILASTRRPDGTLRKSIRIRAGYNPQDEVAIYQSKGSIWKKEMSAIEEVPPGYDQLAESKPKSKSAKRNERKKEKRQQAALNKGDNSEKNDVSSADTSNDFPETVESTSSKMNDLSLSENASVVTTNSTECSNSEDQVQDIDKKIRALKKKIRLTEAQQQKTMEADMKPEQMEKVAKLEDWRKELKRFEDKKSELRASIS
ncbi:partner of Y14-MAGO [Perilla frutescens var. hirtella]|uniref:Partner of Y14-MAGO n=1 Tax=Perilla frutescens var. hirtella TaxID=608512 RepID=A0AAD4P594_PERFH|nr:partner of Y14-MAGO [Perilla frutescens var. hirtella]